MRPSLYYVSWLFLTHIQIPIPNKYHLGCGYKGLGFCRNNGWIMENMDMPQNLPAQFDIFVFYQIIIMFVIYLQSLLHLKILNSLMVPPLKNLRGFKLSKTWRKYDRLFWNKSWNIWKNVRTKNYQILLKSVTRPKVLSMSFYPDFIQILSDFLETHFILILSIFYPNSGIYLDEIKIKPG